jgi:DNA polymerase-3 subunit epsilon
MDTRFPLATPVDELCFTFIDVETTGLDAATGDRVCEIAVLRVHAGQEKARFEALVYPQRPMSVGAMAVNGITDAMLSNAPVFAEILPIVHAFLHDAIVVAHNARFDVGFLQHEWSLAGHTLPSLVTVDTLIQAQARYRFPHNSLAAIATELGLATLPTHRAMADVLTTWQVLQRFIDDMRQEGPVTLAHLLYPCTRFSGFELTAMMTLLEEALTANTPLQLRYQGRNAPETLRIVQPLAMYYERGHGYLRAFCHMRQEERHFRFDRITALQPVSGSAGQAD